MITDIFKGEIIEMADAKEELDVLLADKEVTVNGNKVVVKRLSFLDTLRLTQHLSGIVTRIINDADTFSSALTKIMYKSDNPETDTVIRANGLLEITNSLGEDGIEFLMDIIVKSTSLTEDEIEEIDCEAGIDLAFDIYEVNKGFFMRCLKKLKPLMEEPKKTRAKKS